MKIKSIQLENTFGYKKAFFDFTNEEGNIKPFAMFFGPNGIGKSSILNVAAILSYPLQFNNRDFSTYFRKMIFHENYIPGYDSFQTFSHVMTMEAVFNSEEGDKKIRIQVDPKNPESAGIVLNEIGNGPFAFFSDADHPSNLYRFQLEAEVKDIFLDIASEVYGYNCLLESEIEDEDILFYTDFVIEKENDTKVHYKRMSGGEKKIATLLSQLCSPSVKDKYSIFLIDNLEKEVYFKRHHKLYDKLSQHFASKQILATTHSSILVGCPELDILPYVPRDYLYDIEIIKSLQ